MFVMYLIQLNEVYFQCNFTMLNTIASPKNPIFQSWSSCASSL